MAGEHTTICIRLFLSSEDDCAELRGVNTDLDGHWDARGHVKVALLVFVSVDEDAKTFLTAATCDRHPGTSRYIAASAEMRERHLVIVGHFIRLKDIWSTAR